MNIIINYLVNMFNEIKKINDRIDKDICYNETKEFLCQK